MPEDDPILDSLMRCADLDVDLTEPTYARFFAACPEAVPLMGHSDEYMRGRMLEQIYQLFMDDTLFGTAGGYLRWEVDNHVDAYGVHVDMYDKLLAALKEAVASSLGADFSAAHGAAWDRRIEAILRDIRTHAATLESA